MENRLRLTREVIDAVRGVVKPKFVLGVRISADELQPGDKVLIAPGTSDTVDEVIQPSNGYDFRIRLHGGSGIIELPRWSQVITFT